MNRELDQDDLRQVVGERLQRDVLGPMENRVNWILTVVRNGPLLGLFGTVLGMMAAFGASVPASKYNLRKLPTKSPLP